MMQQNRPNSGMAVAQIHGSDAYPEIHGKVTFRQMRSGVLVTAEICGLPEGSAGVFGFHIHAGGSCSGTQADPFADAGGHYNPQAYPHPYHAGDLPPLFGNQGCAYLSVLTGRFTVEEVVGRTVIIHARPDDFKTQPSGDAGARIACGKIMPLR